MGKNFSLFTMWACRYGEQVALKKQNEYEAKLDAERKRLVRVRAERVAQGLRSCDIVDRIRGLRPVDTVTEGIRNMQLAAPAPPQPRTAHSRLMTRIQELVAARQVDTKGSKLDLASTIR